MTLIRRLQETLAQQPEAHFETFARTLDPSWITQALHASNRVSIRRRKLPAERVVWLILGMALLRDRSIQAVCDHLHLVLADGNGRSRGIGSAALVEARDR